MTQLVEMELTQSDPARDLGDALVGGFADGA
jgi:hypothetical protein